MVNQLQLSDANDLNLKFNPVFTGFDNAKYSSFESLKNKNLVVALNIRSFLRCKDDITYLLEQFPNIRVLCLSEIWHFPDNIFIDNYDIYSNPRKDNRWGGVAIFIDKSIKHKKINFLQKTTPYFESVGIQYELNNRKSVVISVYRPPELVRINIENFYHELQQLINLTKKDFPDSEIEICGDINIDIFNYKSLNLKNELMNFATTNELLVGINLPTRENKTHNTYSCIDQFLSSEPIESNYHIIDISLSDHWAIVKCLDDYTQNVDDAPIFLRKYSDNEKVNFKTKLLNCNWQPIFDTELTIVKFELFFNNVDTCFNESFPLKKIKASPKKSSVPWKQSNAIKSYIAEEKRLFRKSVRSMSVRDRETHKNYKAWLEKTIRQSRINYFKRFFRQNAKNSKAIWSQLNSLIGKKPKQRLDCNELNKGNGQLTNDRKEIANIFNDFFTSVGKSLSDKIIPDKNNQEIYFKKLSNCYPNIPSFKFTPLSIPEIIKIGKSLQPKKSAGPDNIPGIIAKICILTIPEVIQNILNSSLKTGRIPDRLKCADIITLHKKGEKADPNNYRPISLLNSFSKILEKTVSSQLIDHLDKYDILNKHQFGFRKGHSTIHALLHFIHKRDELSKEKKKIASIFIDLTKAFDTCNHYIIIKKLEILGVKNQELSWFKNYLNGRKQRVKINDTFSDFKNIDLGVPQGSILGPLLFSIYINDFPEILNLFAVLFADDTTIVIDHNENNQLQVIANKKLQSALEWFNTNELTLNAAKTRVIHFNNHEVPNLQINSTQIMNINSKNSEEKTFKFLGFHINEKTTLDEHILCITKKILSANYALRNLKHTLEPREKRLVYYSLVQSNLEYGISIYGNNKNAVKKIISLQKRAICYVNGIKKVHSEPLFKKFKILKFEDLKTVNDLYIAHSVVYGYAPDVIKSDIKKIEINDLHDLRRNILDLECNGAQTKSITKFIIPNVWNNLDEAYKKISKPHLFKKAIKQKILRSYSGSINCTNQNCYICG